MINLFLFGILMIALIDLMIDMISARMNYVALAVNRLPRLPRTRLKASAKRQVLHTSNVKSEGGSHE